MKNSDPVDMVLSLYALVSGASADERDWDSVRILFHGDARLRSLRHDAVPPVARDLGVEAWIEAARDRFRIGDFHEDGVISRDIRSGAIATLISPYAASRTPEGEPFEIGINHFNFRREDGRWRIVQIQWEAWPADHPDAPVCPSAETAL